ncbi:MAG TPA: M23 family metallopeptidase [Micromonosporaceae bacterium]|nr:M23 family metallopeptidase [Micromonosporaceae bacterium]
MRKLALHLATVLALVAATTLIFSSPASAYRDPGWPSPNGTSPWLYSESWFISGSWYNEGYHTETYNDYYAIDFANPYGGCWRNLYAYWNGMTVTYVNHDIGSLYMTKSIDGWQYRVKYLHMAQINVAVGNVVGTNTLVGYSGTKGNSTGCHLHLSVHRYHPETGWWHSIEPMFCGRTYPHDHVTWFPGCP